MKVWLREPLLHFFLVGALLFSVYTWLGRGGGDEPRVVHISAADVNWLKETWTRQWQRPPDEQDLRGLVADYLKEELLVREAKEMGLDENDTIVRRRLAQKMAFIVEDTARLAEPSDETLYQLYDTRRALYQTPARISFTQLYFKTEADAWRGLQDLKTRGATELGTPSLLERDYAQADEQTVTSLFGGAFAANVFALEPGRWQGPVGSGYGSHLVRISERLAAQPRPFAEVRAQVLDEWQRVQQAKADEQFLAGLLKKYKVVVDQDIKPLIGPLAVVAR